MKNKAILLGIPLLMIIAVVLNLLINEQQKANNLSHLGSVSCPPKPTATLEKNKVKDLELNSNMLKVSGTVTNTENLGYIFTAELGQSFLYSRPDDICFWVYRPDNNLLTQSMIPLTGRYVIQIASSSTDSKNFALSIGLNVANSEYREYLTTRASYNINSPKTFIIDYYQKINEGRYTETWHDLSANFKASSGNYFDYQQWWDQVQEVKIGRVETIEQSENTATINIELWYLLKSGLEVYDSKRNVYLIWDKQKANWLIESKKSI